VGEPAARLDAMKPFSLCFRRWWSAGCLVIPCLGGLQAAETFRIYTEPLKIPERGEVTDCVLWLAGRRFDFIPPPHWSVKPAAGQAGVNLVREDLSAGIRVRIRLAKGAEKPELKGETLRQRILARYPGARISPEFKCYTCGEQGLAFDVSLRAEKDTPVACRIAFVAFAGGSVEFELTSAPEKIGDNYHALGALLRSFRIGQPAPPNGKEPRKGGSGAMDPGKNSNELLAMRGAEGIYTAHSHAYGTDSSHWTQPGLHEVIPKSYPKPNRS
jgi:hypothetical protein